MSPIIWLKLPKCGEGRTKLRSFPFAQLNRYLLKGDFPKSNIVAVLFLAGFSIIVFGQIFLAGEPLRPGADSFFLDYPFRVLAWESVHNGEMPLWNPYNSGGVNLMGQPFFFLIYPPYSIVYLVSKDTIFYVLSAVQIFHIILALSGMFFLLRKIIGNFFIALWGAILYGFSYSVVDAFVIGQLLVSYAYLPWVILFLYTFEERTSYLNILGLSLLFFLLVAGGFLQWTVFSFFIITFFIIFRYLPDSKEAGTKLRYALTVFFISLGVAFLLGAVEFVPFLEQNLNGARAAIRRPNGDGSFFHAIPWLSFRLFIPDFFNVNLINFVRDESIFLSDNFNSFFGIVPAILLFIGIFTLQAKELKPWKYLAKLILALMFSLPFIVQFFIKTDVVYARIGCFLPFLGIIIACAVVQESVTQRQKALLLIKVLFLSIVFLVLLLFCFAFYGKDLFGADLDLRFIQSQITTGILFVFFYLALFYLFYKNFMNQSFFLFFLIILALLEIQSMSLQKIKPHLSTRLTSEYFQKTQSEIVLDALLGSDKDLYRVHNTSVRFEEIVRYTGGPYMHYFPNGNIFNHFYEANAYILNMQKDVGQLLTNAEGGHFIRMADLLTYNSLPRLLSIKYIIAQKDFDPYNVVPSNLSLNPRIKSKVVEDFIEETPRKKIHLKIIELENVPPKYFFAEKIILNQKRDELFGAVINENFDPRKITFFEDDIPGFRKEQTLDTRKQKVISVEAPSANKVVVKVAADSPGVLVANNFWHKWWKVKVNGKDQKIYRVNYLFQAVMIAGGDSELFFYTDSDSLRNGLVCTVIGFVILLLLLAVNLKKRAASR